MSDEIKWDKIQQFLCCSDEKLEEVKQSPRYLKLFRAAPKILKLRIIAECTHAEGCNARLEPGQRYVFNGVGILIPEETTARVCMSALSVMTAARRVMHDRVCEGIDPNGLVFDTIRCPDPHLDWGGVGRAIFKMRAEMRE